MGKDEKLMKFIKDECNAQKIYHSEFVDKIESSMILRGADLGKRKSESTINRWMNGEVTPDPCDYPYIADALGVTEDELRCGHRINKSLSVSQEEVEEQEQRKREMNAILNLIRMNKYFNTILSIALFSLGLFCINNSLWKNSFVAIGSLSMFLLILAYDNRNESEPYDKPKEKLTLLSVMQKFLKDISEFWKICKMPSLIGPICTICFWIIIFVSFLPFIESVLYDGKMLVSSGLYLMLSVFFLLRSKKDS